MTSEIRTNTLTSRAGLSTVTLTDSGPMFSGITTFVDNSTFSVGTGGTIHAPATNTLNIGVNNTESLRIDSNSNLKIAGVCTATHFYGNGSNLTGITGTTINNNTNNYVITGTGTANTLQGEANLQFDGTQLGIGGSPDVSFHIKSAAPTIRFTDTDTNRFSQIYAVDGNLRFDADNNNAQSGTNITFRTDNTERLRIDSSGHMGLGVTPNANWPTNNDFKALQIGTGACVFGRGSGDEDRGGIAVNWYTDGSNQKYIGNGHAARIYLADGNIYFQNAASNSSGAGAAMTLNTRLQVDATDGHIDFTGSTSSTLGYVFQNGTSGASADTRVLIKSYANSGADPYIKFDAGGQDMIVGTSYSGGTDNLLCLGPGSVPSINNHGLRINGLGKTLLSYLAPGQDSIIDLQNKRTRANGHMYGVDFRDSSNESNANIVVKQNSGGNNAAEMRFYVNPGTGGNGITNGNLIMTLTQGGDVDIESDLDVGGTLSIASGYVTLQKRDSDDNTRTYIHSRGNAYGGNQAFNGDNRSPSPSDFKKGCGMSCFFSSINGNNSGGYIDAMHFSTYSDSSGGSPTMLGMSKSGNNIYYYRHGWLNNGHMATTDYSNASKYSVSMSSVSDARAKEEVKSVANTDALSLVSQLRPVTYKWTDEYINDGGSRNAKENQFTYGTPLTEGGPPPATRVGISTANKVVNIGFIAQEVELVIPTVVHQDRVSIGGTTEHWKNIDYDKLVPYLTGAIKGLIEKVEVLEQDNIALRARVTNLEGQ